MYEYEQELDNPSSIKQSKHSLEVSKHNNNSKQSKILKGSQKIEQNNESYVYENEFENAAE